MNMLYAEIRREKKSNEKNTILIIVLTSPKLKDCSVLYELLRFPDFSFTYLE